jgi:GntR family transcriptional regulator
VDESLPVDNRVAYRALAEELRRAIARGDFAGGKRLPTEAELSASHGLSRQTVRRALQELVAEALVFRVRGRGTYATPMSGEAQYLRSFGPIADLALSVDTTMELLGPLERRADVNAASRLNLGSDQVMVVLIRRFQDEVPFSVSQCFVPLDVGRSISESGKLPKVGDVGNGTVIGLIDDLYPGRIVGAHQSVTASTVPAEFGPLIECEPGDAVLRIDRLYIDVRGQGVELAISYFNPARYSYRLELRRSVGQASAAR